MSKQPPPAPTASAVGPCPTLIRLKEPLHWKFTKRHRTTRLSLPTPPPTQKQMDNRRPLLTVMQCRAGQTVLSQDRSRKAKLRIPLNTAKHFIHQFQQFVYVSIYVPSVISKKTAAVCDVFFLTSHILKHE